VSFVDLAGSERMRDARNADESQMREASGINRSLFTLGKVAARLAGGAAGSPGVPSPLASPPVGVGGHAGSRGERRMHAGSHVIVAARRATG